MGVRSEETILYAQQSSQKAHRIYGWFVFHFYLKLYLQLELSL